MNAQLRSQPFILCGCVHVTVSGFREEPNSYVLGAAIGGGLRCGLSKVIILKFADKHYRDLGLLQAS
jgi:hypothetical protein